MIKYLFFLIIPFVLIVPAYAEVGRNFDTVDLGNDFVRWTSHYERVYDGDSWENYILTNDANQIKFESSGVSFIFDKTSCDFKLFNPDTQTLAIDSYKFDLTVDAVSRPTSSCDVVNLLQTADDVSFIIDRTEFQTLFEFEPSTGLEWTHELDNTEGKESTFTITETCTDCNPVSISGNKIDFGVYTLDTKNEVHNTVKETRPDKGNYIIAFEKTIPDKATLEIDPTFTSNNPTVDGYITDSDDNGACATASAKDTAAASLAIFVYEVASANDCISTFIEWNISSIPLGANVIDTIFRFESGLPVAGLNCDVTEMSLQPSTATNQQIMTDIHDGTVFVNNNSFCVTLGINNSLDLGIDADTDVESQLSVDWFAIGIKADNEVQDATRHEMSLFSEEGAGTPDPTLEITYINPAEAVDDLIATDIRGTSVDLAWTAPTTVGTIIGYQINSTTPWSSNVATIAKNNTGSTTTSATVSGLSGETQYSFRVGARVGDFVNASGNVLNITTDFDPTASFTPGTIDIGVTGNDTRAIIFERNDINANDMYLNITVDSDWNLACDIHYKFANSNQTYTTIANTTIDSETDAAAFRFNDVENEVIDVLCWDQYDPDNEGRFVITQTMFPLLEQVSNFTSGVYGTQGNFGSLDFITIIVVIISMVGFNRNNELVGIILSLFLIGGLAVLSAGTIISWGPTLTAVFALIIMWGIGTARKD